MSRGWQLIMLQIYTLSQDKHFKSAQCFLLILPLNPHNMLSISITSLKLFTKELLIIWSKDSFFFIVLNGFVTGRLRSFLPFWKISSPLPFRIVYSIVLSSPWFFMLPSKHPFFYFSGKAFLQDFISFNSCNCTGCFRAQVFVSLVF